MILVYLQIKSSFQNLLVFLALKGQFNTAQGFALDSVKLGFQPERNTEHIYNL